MHADIVVFDGAGCIFITLLNFNLIKAGPWPAYFFGYTLLNCAAFFIPIGNFRETGIPFAGC